MSKVKVRMGGLTGVKCQSKDGRAHTCPRSKSLNMAKLGLGPGVQGQSKDGWAHWCQISEHATILRNLARKGSYSLLTFATQTHQFLYLLQTDVTPFLFQRTEL